MSSHGSESQDEGAKRVSMVMDRPAAPAASEDGQAVALPEPILGVVVITRNEAARVGHCIESVLAGTAGFPNTPIVVVDSDSSDDTAAVAAGYPVAVYRYRGPRMSAAAGRRIGAQCVTARYVFFIDGDCRLAPGWLERAVELMEESDSVGVVCGGRRNAYDSAAGIRLEDAGWDLGGTALYRSEALLRAGSFNPFIRGNEEQELLARVLAAGYHKVVTDELMAVHYTGLKESVDGLWRRHRNGMLEGPGQVLRASLSTGTFWYHARLFNRYILTFLFIAIGVVCVLAELWDPIFLGVWMSVGWLFAVALSLRRRSVRDAMFIVADWVLVALDGIPSFLRAPIRPDAFECTLELLSTPEGRYDPPLVIAAPRPVAADVPTGASLAFLPVDQCLTPAFRAEWDALIVASGNVYGQYQSAEWLAHLEASRGEKLLAPLVARHPDGRLAGVMPTLLLPHDLNFEFREHFLWRARLRAVSILGGVPLLPPDPKLHDAALAAVSEVAPDVECIYFHSVPTRSFCWRHLQESPWVRERFDVYRPDNVRPFHMVKLPATFDEYLGKFKHKKRYNLARQERLLREHVGGELELRRIERPDQVEAFRTAVVSVIRESWQGRAAIPEAYAIVHDPKPFEDLARRGLFRSYVLDCAGEPRAFVLGYQYGDVFHYAEIAYSETFRRFSPGTTLLYMLIRDLLDHRPPRVLNFGIGDAPYKREFGNVHVEDASVLLLRKTLRTRALRRSHSAFHALVRSVGRRLREARPNASGATATPARRP